MLTFSTNGISSARLSGSYYVEAKRGSQERCAEVHSYDSAMFSAEAERNDFCRSLVGRLTQEVRTANTTGDIQALRAQVSAGAYMPDCMAIAGRLLYTTGE